eukprot:9495873-Pyramimonas_sp.AAC.1
MAAMQKARLGRMSLQLTRPKDSLQNNVGMAYQSQLYQQLNPFAGRTSEGGQPLAEERPSDRTSLLNRPSWGKTEVRLARPPVHSCLRGD